MNTVKTNDNSFKCPHCGESYQILRNWDALVAENPHTVTCAGEDGCGKDFEVVFSDQE